MDGAPARCTVEQAAQADLHLADRPIFLAYRVYRQRVKHAAPIMDRYFCDTLVYVAGSWSRGYLRFLAAITPEPSIAVSLDVGPQEAFARKGERSLEQLQQRSCAYKRVFHMLRCPVIQAPTDAADTPAQLEHLRQARLVEGSRGK